MLQLIDFTLKFPQKQAQRAALTIDNFQIEKGELLALLGESGSGKTLLSLAIIGLLPDSVSIGKGSQILFNGVDLSSLAEVSLKKIRGKKISMIFQEPMTSLNPVMTVGAQVAEVLITHRICKKLAIKNHVIKLFNQVELKNPEELYGNYPHQLSGGMKQRIMIAMALAAEPDLLIADEPTSALDVSVQHDILKLLKKIQHDRGLSILFITHDISIVKNIADRVAVIYAGRLMEVNTTQAFFKNPLHPYSKALFQSAPIFAKRGSALQSIEGVVPPLTEVISGCIFYQRCSYRKNACLLQQPPLISTPNGDVACVWYENGNVITEDFVHAKSPNDKVITQQQINPELILSLDDVKVYFPIKKGILKRTKGFIKAVDGVSFQLRKGKTTAIVGESGCGKTTLAKAILGLVPHTEGTISFAQMHTTEQRAFRKYAQIIFQDPFSSLNPRMLVGDIIAEGMLALKIGNAKSQADRVAKLIQQMGLPEDSILRYPHEFSGGQRQRICIARALAVEPKVIICDEPTSALDLSIQAQIINLLRNLQRDAALTYLFITHNMSLVSYFADEIILMKKGKIIEMGDAAQILNAPEQAYTKKLIAIARSGEIPD